MAINQAIYWALSNRDRIIYWVSPTAGQASKIYKQFINAFGNSPIITQHKGSQGDTEILFANNSTIKFRSAAQEDSLRGESVDYVICDEVSFIKESVIKEIILPMLNVRGKKMLLISTPKGKNHFYTYYLKGLSDNEKYKSFHFTSADNPHSQKDIIEMAMNDMPKAMYEQEYLAKFVDSATLFDDIDNVCILNPITSPVYGQNYWIGVDIGMKNDYTVVTVFNQQKEMVYMDRFTNIQAPQLKERLIKTFNLFKPKKIYIENNNQGQPIIDDLVQLHKVKNIVSFNTNTSTKSEIINNLINAFNSKSIKLINDDKLKKELEFFTVTYSSTGHSKFSAPNGYNDDIVMSLAIALECLNKNLYTGKISFL